MTAQLNPSEISDLIKSRIEKLELAATKRTEGSVVSVTDGICRVHGLADVMQGEMLEFPIGPELIGRVVNALGQPIDGKGPINAKLKDPIEKIAPGVIERQSVSQPVQTGLKSIDSMVPVGRGQRELIIGDRQTGKTAVAVDAIINQKGK